MKARLRRGLTRNAGGGEIPPALHYESGRRHQERSCLPGQTTSPLWKRGAGGDFSTVGIPITESYPAAHPSASERGSSLQAVTRP